MSEMRIPPFSRRRLVQAAGSTAAAGFLPAAAAPSSTLSANVYTRLGVRPFINTTATLTINGGAPMHPEVRKAMDEAALWAVNLDELMEKVGARIAELLGAEAAIVTAGCASALCHATAAAIAGCDPERMKRLPDSTGMRNEVLIAKQSRNDYDHAYRTGGGKLIEFDSREEFLASFSRRTGLVVVLGTGEAKGKVRLEEIAEIAHKRNVPVIVDAAAELPFRPNPYLSRGADLAGYSGGKILRGPQSAGLLIGRKDLVRAAFLNSAPHHGYGRAMKVSKEEIAGMCTAIELFSRERIEADYRTWESWLHTIAESLHSVPGVTTKMSPPAGASPFPVLHVSWDPSRIFLTGDEVHAQLLDGEPRIMSHAAGDATSFVIRPVAMRPEHPPIVARRMAEVFRNAPTSPKAPPAPPATDLTGAWDVAIEFISGKTHHTLVFDPPKGNAAKLYGLHFGKAVQSHFNGAVSGDHIRLQSTLPLEGMHIHYDFQGTVSGDTLSGDLSLGEFGMARFTARRI